MPAEDKNRSTYYKQWGGALIGAAAGWLLALLFPAMSQRLGLIPMVLWGAAVGAALTNLDGFARAGAALTRRENRALNLAIGLGIPVLLLLLIGLVLR